MIRKTLFLAAMFALASCTQAEKPTPVVDTVCTTQKPMCWRDSWPDDAIVQAKTHNAKLFALCPAIKSRVKVICAQVSAETDLVLRSLPTQVAPAPLSVPAKKQVPP